MEVRIPTIDTPHLRLRPFEERDLDPLADIYSDVEVMRFLNDGKPRDRAETWHQIAMFIGHWHFRGYGVWAVEEKGSGEFVGRVGLFYPEGWPGLEVIWTIARSRWGRGYATEAGRASIEYGFNSVRAPRLISIIHPGNRNSIRVAEKVGERLDGQIQFRGKLHSVYAIQGPEN